MDSPLKVKKDKDKLKVIKYKDHSNYSAQIKFNCNGKISKNEILGGIFGQTKEIIEGLDYQYLQNTQQIGRISIECQYNAISEKTTGVITLPVNADRKKTSYIVGILELIDKVGSVESKFEVMTIRDLKQSKKLQLIKIVEKIERTKFEETSAELAMFESKQLQKMNIYSKMNNVGGEHWAGTDFENQQIYLVEGRGDIHSLNRIHVYNTLSLNGNSYQIEILESLLKNKKVTMIPDGDSGGHKLFEKIFAKFYSLIKRVVKMPIGYKVESSSAEKLAQFIIDNVVKTEDFILTSPYLDNKKELLNLIDQ